MFPNRSNRLPVARAFGRAVLACGLCWLVAAGGSAVAASPATRSAAEAVALRKPDPDTLLIDVYKNLAANNLRNALSKADALVEAYPNFLLGHLIRGDLLLMHTRPVNTFGATGAANNVINVTNGSAEKLKNLREEAIARLKSLRERPDPGMVPRAVMQLRDDQRFALVVDTKRSRLYVYENQGGQLKFATDYYISQGKLGVNKLKEGDQKTPLGVYYITARLAGSRLPDFYGAGALPISYPNEWDKINGRSGSGIWLHGTPSDSFSRPPLSSDGCVVLTNPDLYKLSASVDIGKTPVIISDQVEFVSKSKSEAERNAAAKLVDTWRSDLESMDSARLLNNYSRKFKTKNDEGLASWFAKQKSVPGARNISIKLRDISFFRYPGQDDLIVSTFTQDAVIGKGSHSVRKRQYWAKEGPHWKIVSESNW